MNQTVLELECAEHSREQQETSPDIIESEIDEEITESESDDDVALSSLRRKIAAHRNQDEIESDTSDMDVPLVKKKAKKQSQTRWRKR